MITSVLIIEADAGEARKVADMLKGVSLNSLRVQHVSKMSDALTLVSQESMGVVLCALSSQGGTNLDDVAKLRTTYPALPVIALATRSEETLARQACQKNNTDDYLIKEELSASLLERTLDRVARQRRLERELAASEMRYRAMLDNSMCLICTHDLNGVLLSVNTATARLLGYEVEELVGSNLRDRFSTAAQGRFGDYLRRLRQSGHDAGQITINDRAGHEHMLLYTNVMHQQDGAEPQVISYAQDITGPKRMEAMLVESDNRFRALASHLPMGIVIADAQGKYTYVNERWRQITGLSSHQAMGEGWVAAVHPDDKDAVLSAWRDAVKAARPCLLEYRHRSVDGRVTTVSSSAVVLNDTDNHVSGYLCTVTDIKDRKQNEETLRELSLVDPLTGLYNQRGFLTLAEQNLRLAKRIRAQVTLFFVDVDEMKKINETHGRAEADRALVATAALLRAAVRESDVIARLREHAFAIFLFGGERDTPEIIQGRLQRLLKDYNASGQLSYPLVLKVGVMQHEPTSVQSVETLLAQSDAIIRAQKQVIDGKQHNG